MKVFKKQNGDLRTTPKEALKFTPVKNTEIKETRQETGEVLLNYSVKIRPWFVGLIRRLGKETESLETKKLQLDELGTTVWDLINGTRSVKQIIQLFAEKYQLHIKEAEVSVTQFLRELGKRGLIGLK